jgi:hypothetical protein
MSMIMSISLLVLLLCVYDKCREGKRRDQFTYMYCAVGGTYAVNKSNKIEK